MRVLKNLIHSELFNIKKSYPFSKIVLQMTSFTPKFVALSTEKQSKFQLDTLKAGFSFLEYLNNSLIIGRGE